MKIDTPRKTHYVPILKAKAGESEAMAQLPAAARETLMPFFDIPRPSSIWSTTLDDQIQKKPVVTLLERPWAKDQSI